MISLHLTFMLEINVFQIWINYYTATTIILWLQHGIVYLIKVHYFIMKPCSLLLAQYVLVLCHYSYGGGSRSNSESRGRNRGSHSRSISPRSLSRSLSPADGGRTTEVAKSKTTSSAGYSRSSRENGREPVASSRYGYNNGQIHLEAAEGTKRRYEGGTVGETGKRLARDEGGRSSSRSRSPSSSQRD